MKIEFDNTTDVFTDAFRVNGTVVIDNNFTNHIEKYESIVNKVGSLISPPYGYEDIIKILLELVSEEGESSILRAAVIVGKILARQIEAAIISRIIVELALSEPRKSDFIHKLYVDYVQKRGHAYACIYVFIVIGQLMEAAPPGLLTLN